MKYQCYDGMEFSFEGDKMEPVHIIQFGLATRDANITDEDISKLEDQALKRLTELKREDFTKHLSGDKGQCKYQLAILKLKPASQLRIAPQNPKTPFNFN